MSPRALILFLLSTWISVSSAVAAEVRKTELLIFVSTDGVRWQDVFRGADETLLTKQPGGIRGTELQIRRQWWRTDVSERRQLVMPFLWNTIGQKGQLWGNRDAGSACRVLNPYNVSYPGYSEFLCGFVDEALKNNEPIPNPNTSVLEWLSGHGSTQGRVAAVNCWTTLTSILNADRSHLPMWTYGAETPRSFTSPVVQQINALAAHTPVPWTEGTWDSFVYTVARDFLVRSRPRLLYVNFGETDEWAHAGRYDRYLDALHNVDAFLQGLWEAAQSISEFNGKVTLVVTTDHGRGTGPLWTSHGPSLADSAETWFGIVGPDTPALGERRNVDEQKTAGAAATIARLLGEEWTAVEPRASSAWPVLSE